MLAEEEKSELSKPSELTRMDTSLKHSLTESRKKNNNN